jgi:hypothetical protein
VSLSNLPNPVFLQKSVNDFQGYALDSTAHYPQRVVYEQCLIPPLSVGDAGANCIPQYDFYMLTMIHYWRTYMDNDQ